MKKTSPKTAVIKKVIFIMSALLTVPVIHALAWPNSPGVGFDAGIPPICAGLNLLVAAGLGYGLLK